MENDRLKTPFLSWKKINEIIYLIIACVFNGLKLICLEQFVQYLKQRKIASYFAKGHLLIT